MSRTRLGQVVAAIGLAMFIGGWSVGSISSTGRSQDHTPEAMYGGIMVFLAGVWILMKDAT